MLKPKRIKNKKEKKSKGNKQVNNRKKYLNIQEDKRNALILIVCMFVVILLSDLLDGSLRKDFYKTPLIYYILITLLFKKEIESKPLLNAIKAWISIFVFFVYGMGWVSEYLIVDIMFVVLIVFLIAHNSRAFFKSIELSYVKTNLSIALANIFQIIIAYGIIYKLIFYYIPNSFRLGLMGNSSFEVFVDFVYFSFATFTTLGYGDIVPTNVVSKALVISEVGLFLSLVTISIIFISNRKENNGSKVNEKID